MRGKFEEAYNPSIMIKNFKYDKNNNIIHSKNKFTFNTTTLLTLADISYIIQKSLNEYNGIVEKNYFYNDSLRNNKLREFFTKNVQPSNPLDNNIDYSKKEYIVVGSGDWRFFYDETKFTYTHPLKFTLKNNDFFVPSNFEKIKL